MATNNKTAHSATNQVLKRLSAVDLPMPSRPEYRGAVKAFNLYAAGRPLTEELVKAFFAELIKKAKPRTARHYKTSIKQAVLEYVRSVDPAKADSAKFLGWLDQLFRSVKLPKVSSHVQPDEVLTAREVDQLIEATDERFGLMIAALYSTGFRISELLGIKVADCKKHRGKQAVGLTVIGKGSKERTVYVDRSLFDAIAQAFAPKRDGFLFRNNRRRKGDYTRQWFGKRLATLSRRVLGARVHPHLFRHSRATDMLREGLSIGAVSRFLGHSDPRITLQFYGHDQLAIEQHIGGGHTVEGGRIRRAS